MADLVSFKDIARDLCINPSTVARLIDRFGGKLGISVQKGRGNTTNAKWTHYLSREDADTLATFYKSGQSNPENYASDNQFRAFGSFYVIQLVPEALPNRIKIGYADNLEARLADHQTAAPTARIIASWPCKRSWDYAAMDSITRVDCTWVQNEVFEGNPDGFVQRGNAFFSLMPKSNEERALSPHSPMRTDKLTSTNPFNADGS